MSTRTISSRRFRQRGASAQPRRHGLARQVSGQPDAEIPRREQHAQRDRSGVRPSLARVSRVPRPHGQRSDALLGRDLAHWSFFFDSDASVMEGNDIEDLGGGSFRTVAAVQRYSLLDQYAMGLVPDSARAAVLLCREPDEHVCRPHARIGAAGRRHVQWHAPRRPHPGRHRDPGSDGSPRQPNPRKCTGRPSSTCCPAAKPPTPAQIAKSIRSVAPGKHSSCRPLTAG